jgi:hypothetical protein
MPAEQKVGITLGDNDVSASNPLPVTVSGGGGTQTVTGTVSIAGTVATTGTVAVSGTVATTGTVAVSGTVATQKNRSATGTQSRVASANSSTTLLASNASRLGATISNNSTSDLYILLKTGGTASSTAYSYHLPAAGVVDSVFEVPFGFTGDIIGIWTSANGFAYVTEYT